MDSLSSLLTSYQTDLNLLERKLGTYREMPLPAKLVPVKAVDFMGRECLFYQSYPTNIQDIYNKMLELSKIGKELCTLEVDVVQLKSVDSIYKALRGKIASLKHERQECYDRYRHYLYNALVLEVYYR